MRATPRPVIRRQRSTDSTWKNQSVGFTGAQCRGCTGVALRVGDSSIIYHQRSGLGRPEARGAI